MLLGHTEHLLANVGHMVEEPIDRRVQVQALVSAVTVRLVSTPVNPSQRTVSMVLSVTMLV